MYIKKAISNICERYASNSFNILYEPINNLFDICISLLPYNLFVKENFLYQYNMSICNNILAHAQKSNNNGYVGLNTICCIHSYKPINLKKEDLYLIDQNLTNTYKVFFCDRAQQSWGITSNTSIIPYGIPDVFINTNKNRRYTVGLFNNNSESLKIITSVLKEKNVSYKLISNSPTVVDDLNECLYTIEMNEHNLINSLCARACGCINLMPRTKDLQENFSEDIVLFNDIGNMLSLITGDADQNIDRTDIKKRYSYSEFQKHMSQICEQANNEVSLI